MPQEIAICQYMNPEEEVIAVAKAMETCEDIATMRRIFPS